jgi:hypothetical protein
MKAKVLATPLFVVIALQLQVVARGESVDVLIKGMDDGVKTTKQQDYNEAVMNAKLQAIERAGVEIASITKVVNFQTKFDMVETKAKAVLTAGFQVMDMGYQTDGSYQVVLSGRVQIGEKQIASPDKLIRLAEIAGINAGRATNRAEQLRFLMERRDLLQQILRTFPDSAEAVQTAKADWVQDLTTEIEKPAELTLKLPGIPGTFWHISPNGKPFCRSDGCNYGENAQYARIPLNVGHNQVLICPPDNVFLPLEISSEVKTSGERSFLELHIKDFTTPLLVEEVVHFNSMPKSGKAEVRSKSGKKENIQWSVDGVLSGGGLFAGELKSDCSLVLKYGNETVSERRTGLGLTTKLGVFEGKIKAVPDRGCVVVRVVQSDWLP